MWLALCRPKELFSNVERMKGHPKPEYKDQSPVLHGPTSKIVTGESLHGRTP